MAGPAVADRGGHPAGDAALARWLAVRAGARLLRLRTARGHADPLALGDAGDQLSHRFLVRALRRLRPDDWVLSEEGDQREPGRLTAERVWIVDPLDGTRGYREPGRTDWAVHVALWTRAGGLTAGAVALPAQQRVLATDRPPVPSIPARRRPRLVVSYSRPPAYAEAVAAAIGAELGTLGSAGAKVAAVITGEYDAYLHDGGQYEWDSAAPVAVARAVGLHASRLDGSPLRYNQPDPYLPDLLVCRPELAAPLMAAVVAHRLPE
ncbi:MAG TPA: 3'(2'),5'-bisphosphate nucleotidase CysQ [Natronosporangium sp.]|nr:3'(2'),5'-bisphosphate nucleotidase CysQ [Natronosporangium sp.]